MGNLVALLTSFEGRIGRGQFWFGAIVVLFAALVIGAVLIALGLGVATTETGTVQVNGGAASAFERKSWTLSPWPGLILAVVTAYPFAAVGVKRRKDRDFSGIDVLGFWVISLIMQFLAVVGLGGQVTAMVGIALFVWAICLFIVLGVLPGTNGSNRFGPDPLAAKPDTDQLKA